MSVVVSAVQHDVVRSLVSNIRGDNDHDSCTVLSTPVFYHLLPCDCHHHSRHPPDGRSVSQSVSQLVIHSFIHSFIHAFIHSINQSVNNTSHDVDGRTVSQSISQSINPSVNQSVSPSIHPSITDSPHDVVSQSVNQPTNKTNCNTPELGALAPFVFVVCGSFYICGVWPRH